MKLMAGNRSRYGKLLEKPSVLQLEIAASNAEPLVSAHLPTTGIYG